MEKTVNILGVGINNLTFEEVLEYLFKNVTEKKKKTFLATINAEILVSCYRNRGYREVINISDLAVMDGYFPLKAARFLGMPLKERIAGVELVEKLCEEASKQPITVGFLGGKHNVAEVASECLRKKYPGLQIAFAIEEWPGFEANSNAPKCDILFVAFGHPKQETWIAQNLPKIDVWAAMGVGGSFDFLSGRVKRAPKWMRDIGLEWFFRLLIQPWRIKRQSALIYFVLLILKEKFFGKSGET